MQIDAVYIFAMGMTCGSCIGAWWTWHLWLKREKPEVRIIVDKEVTAQITQQMVQHWVDKRGLTWQPKGAAFDLGRGVKNDRD